MFLWWFFKLRKFVSFLHLLLLNYSSKSRTKKSVAGSLGLKCYILNKLSNSNLNKLAIGKKVGSENAAQMTETISHYFVDQRSDTPTARMMSGGSYSC